MAATTKPSGPVDALCVAQACRDVMTDLKCSCRQWAAHHNVPEEVVFAIVADQFIFERSGRPPLEAEYCAQMASEMLSDELIRFFEETKARLAKCSADPEAVMDLGRPPLHVPRLDDKR